MTYVNNIADGSNNIFYENQHAESVGQNGKKKPRRDHPLKWIWKYRPVKNASMEGEFYV